MHTQKQWFDPCGENALREWRAHGYEERDLLLAVVDQTQTSARACRDRLEFYKERYLALSAKYSALIKDEIPYVASETDRAARALWNEGLRSEDKRYQEEQLDKALALWHLVAAESRRDQ